MVRKRLRKRKEREEKERERKRERERENERMREELFFSISTHMFPCNMYLDKNHTRKMRFLLHHKCGDII